VRASVFTIGFVTGLALAGTGVAQSRPTRGVVSGAVSGEADALVAIASRRAHYAVIVGDMRDASSFDGGKLGKRLAAGVARKLRAMDYIAVVQASDATDEVRRQIGRYGLTTLRVEGRVTSIERGMRDGQASVRCRVALLLLDEHGGALRSVVRGAATGFESPARLRLVQDRQLAERALDGALDSALDGVLRVIVGTARQARIAPPTDTRLAMRR